MKNKINTSLYIILKAYIVIGFSFCQIKKSSQKGVLKSNEISVPYGKDSFYKSVIIGSLLPVMDNDKGFKKRFQFLFGEKINIDRQDFVMKLSKIEYLKSESFNKLLKKFLNGYNLKIGEQITDFAKTELCSKLNIEIFEYSGNERKISKKYLPNYNNNYNDKYNNTRDEPIKFDRLNGIQVRFSINIIKDTPDQKEISYDNQYNDNSRYLDHYRSCKPDIYDQYISKVLSGFDSSRQVNNNMILPFSQTVTNDDNQDQKSLSINETDFNWSIDTNSKLFSFASKSSPGSRHTMLNPIRSFLENKDSSKQNFSSNKQQKTSYKDITLQNLGIVKDNNNKLFERIDKLNEITNFMKKYNISNIDIEIKNLHSKLYSKIETSLKDIKKIFNFALKRLENHSTDEYLSILLDIENSHQVNFQKIQNLQSKIKKAQNEKKKLSIELDNANQHLNDDDIITKNFRRDTDMANNKIIKLEDLNKKIKKLEIVESDDEQEDIDVKNNNIKKLLKKFKFSDKKEPLNKIKELKQEISIIKEEYKKNMTDKSKKIKFIKSKIFGLDEELQKYSTDRDKLNERSKSTSYNTDLLKSNPQFDNQKIREYLTSHTSRKKEIERLTKIKNNRRVNSKYSFDESKSIHMIFSIMIYLKKIQSDISKLSLSSQSSLENLKSEVLSILNKYLNIYISYITNMVEKLFSLISERYEKNIIGDMMTLEDTQNLDTNIKTICQYLNEIAASRNLKSLPGIEIEWNTWSQDNILSNIDKLSEYIDNNLSCFSSIDTNLAVYTNHLNYLRSIKKLDMCIHKNNSFSQMYIKYQKNLSKHIVFDIDKICKDIEKMEYLKVYTNIIDIQNISGRESYTTHCFEKINYLLFYSLEKELKSICEKILTLSSSDIKKHNKPKSYNIVKKNSISSIINSDDTKNKLNSYADRDILDLRGKLLKLSQAKDLFFRCENDNILPLRDQDKLRKREEYTKMLLNDWIKNNGELIKNYVKSKEYNKAEKLINRVSIILRFLENERLESSDDIENSKHSTDNVNTISNKNFINKVEKFLERKLNDILTKYKSIKIESIDHIYDPYLSVPLKPNELYDKLQPLLDHRRIYKIVWSKIESDISNKFINLLEQINSDDISGEKFEKIIGICEFILQHLPKEMKSKFSRNLSNQKEIYDRNQENLTKKCELAFYNKEYEKVLIYYKEFMKFRNMQALRSIKKQLSEVLENIIKSINISNKELAIRQSEEYMKDFRDIQRIINKHGLSNDFKNILNKLNNCNSRSFKNLKNRSISNDFKKNDFHNEFYKN